MFTSLLTHDLLDPAALTEQPREPRVFGRVRPSESAMRLESLETRTLFCDTPGMTLEEASHFVGPVQHIHDGGAVTMDARAGVQGQGNGIVSSNRNVIPLVIQNVVRQGNALVAQGMMGDTPFTAPLTLTAEPNPGNEECPILNLELGPIHLDLLGLVVDTSAICLDIIADPEGGILGDLLCGIANLLNDNVPLGQILDNLGDNLGRVLNAFDRILDRVFDNLTAARAVTGVSGTGGPAGEGGFDTTCDILNLSVGPLDLNLLGLEVHLDDCEGGPVTLDITAEEGPGNLLGNLLCALAGLLDNGAPQGHLNQVLRQITRAIDDLV